MVIFHLLLSKVVHDGTFLAFSRASGCSMSLAFYFAQIKDSHPRTYHGLGEFSFGFLPSKGPLGSMMSFFSFPKLSILEWLKLLLISRSRTSVFVLHDSKFSSTTGPKPPAAGGKKRSSPAAVSFEPYLLGPPCAHVTRCRAPEGFEVALWVSKMSQ